MGRPRIYTDDSTCANCGNPYPIAAGLCAPCYQYKRRTGRPRPAQKLQERQLRGRYNNLVREQEREVIVRSAQSRA